LYEPRTYRQQFNPERFFSFLINYRETDLWIGIDPCSYKPEIEKIALKKVVSLRDKLDSFIKSNQKFAISLLPISLKKDSLPEAEEMANQAALAGIGPMSAVAGLFAQEVGKEIISNFSVNEMVVENGGDIFFLLKEKLVLSVFAGNSALSEKVAVVIPAEKTPIGVCTSAGTVGPSKSFGKADAVMVACKSTTLADTLATAFGNKVTNGSQISSVLKLSEEFPDILSLVIICDGKLGIKGNFEVKLLK
jgi:hypothetical protein